MFGFYSHFVRILLLLAAMATGSIGTAAAQGVASGQYRLGPTEVVDLRVVVWDSVSLTFTDLTAISGEYSIASDGTIMLPIIGEIPAAGSTTAELAARIASDLQDGTGLAETPSVAIDIRQYRPIFVLGDVARPGEYPFRPGIRAVQLLALAGGFYRLADEQGSGLMREGIRVAGSLREVRVDLTAARIRESRLLAEAAGAADFALPEGLSHPDGRAAIEQIFQRERILMTTRKEALARSVDSLVSSRDLLETEARLLNNKGEGLKGQVALMGEAVGNIESLVEKGLARSPNLLNMQRALFELEARELDTENQVFRARQSMGEIERDLNEVTQRRATEVLTELQNIQAQIARLKVRAGTQQRILVETQAEAALASEEDETPELVPVFRVSRDAGGVLVTEIVDPEALLSPLDVLEVRWTDPADLPSD